MGLTFNYNGVLYNVIPSVNKASSNLSSARNVLGSIDVPSDFFYRTRLRNISTDVKNVENRVDNTKRWLEDAATAYKKADNKAKEFDSKLKSDVKMGQNSSVVSTIVGAAAVGAGLVVNPVVTIGAIVVKAATQQINYDATATGAKEVKQQKNILAQVGDGIIDLGKGAVNFLADAGKGAWNFVSGLFGKAVDVGAKVAEAFVSGTKKAFDWICDVAVPAVWGTIKSVAASVTNMYFSIVKGVYQFIETLVDLVAIVGTGIASIGTGIADGVSYLFTGETLGATKAMWGGVMGFVAEDHVGNVFNEFYKNTAVGQWLDNNAYDWFKSDGIACKIGSGIGYVAGMIALTIGTMGIGTAAVGAIGITGTAATMLVSGTVTGLVTFSSATASSWADMRDKSWEGIERAYKNGEVDKETYDSYNQIRNLSSEEWAQVEELHKNGELDDDSYNMMKSIRYMSGDWKTTENILGGLKDGSWEGLKAGVITAATMGIGSKLSSFASSKLPALMSKMPNGVQMAGNKLLSNFVEETSETAVEFSSELVIAKGSFGQAFENTGGVFGLAMSYGLGLFLDIDIAGKKLAKNIDVDTLIKRGVDIEVPNNVAKVAMQIDGNDIDDLWKKGTKDFYDSLKARGLDDNSIIKYYNQYENAMTLAKKKAKDGDIAFLAYDSHGVVHITRVSEMSENIANSLSKFAKENSGTSLIELSSKDINNIAIAGQLHDLGMFNEGDLNLNKIRKSHSTNSAFDILETLPISDAYDRDEIALLAFAHSKSTSGIKNQLDKKAWENAILDLNSHDKSFDISRYLMQDGVYTGLSDATLRRLNTGTTAIRLGDAGPLKSGFTQSGATVSLTNAKTVLNAEEVWDSIKKTTPSDQKPLGLAYVKEIVEYDILIDGQRLDITNSAMAYSASIKVGEANVGMPDMTFKNNQFTLEIPVLTDSVPESTWTHAIGEKLGELNGAGGFAKKVDVILPSNASEDVINLYKKKAATFNSDDAVKQRLKDLGLEYSIENVEKYIYKIEIK